jgi:hypothetical protein
MPLPSRVRIAILDDYQIVALDSVGRAFRMNVIAWSQNLTAHPSSRRCARRAASIAH